MDPAHDGSDGHVLGIGDFFIGKADFGEEEKGLADIGAELGEGGGEGAGEIFAMEADGRVLEDGGLGCGIGIVEMDGEAAFSLSAEIEGGVLDDAQEPGAEFASAVELIKMSERFQETLLDGVDGIVAPAAEHAAGDPEGDIEMPPEELFPRGLGACSDQFDQTAVGTFDMAVGGMEHLVSPTDAGWVADAPGRSDAIKPTVIRSGTVGNV
jgi:hypothetical protein